MHKGSLFFKPKPRTKEISRKRWNVPSIVWRAIKKTCMVIGAVVLISALLTVFAASRVGDQATSIPGEFILALTIDSGVGEQGREPTLMDPFPFARPTVRQVVDSLDRAATDDRVKSLLVNLESGGLDIAHIQEIRAAIKRFRASGKKAIIFSTSYGDFGEGLGNYYFASAFDQIWMQPVGMLSIAGIGIEMPFVKTLLEKIGARAQFYQREEYKNAMETFTSNTMSGPSRESITDMVNGLAGQMAAEIAADRNIKVPAFKALVDKGLLTGDEALAAGLIDRLDYVDTLIDETQIAAGGNPDDDKPELVALQDYAAHAPAQRGPKVALVYATGMIAPGGTGEGVADADRIANAILDSADDKDYKALVLRIDSPGGSPTASETIRRAMVKAREKGMIVVVSMGPVAASGGYWIATDSDRIFASPATLTGSIGVIMGKFELSALWEKLGVNWEEQTWGENADLWSVNTPFDAAAAERMNILIDDIYASFVARVAAGRHMTPEQVRSIAKGRAWTGEAAQKIGLVDELGGLDAALDYAARNVSAENRHGITIDVLPKPEGPWEQLISMFGGGASVSEGIKAVETMASKMSVINAGPVAYDPVLDMMR